MNRVTVLATVAVVLPLSWVGFFCCEATATIINVPADYATIQEAVDSSSAGDTVLVQPNTYYEGIVFNGHNIVLGSLFLTTGDTSYIDSTILDGQSVRTPVGFEDGEDTTAVITGFTITNGFGPLFDGGGVRCSNSSPKIVRNRIVNNMTDWYGGGVTCMVGSSPIIRDNIIYGNSTEPLFNSNGGGIACRDNSNPVISGNTITGNYARGGGGIFCYNSSPYISENTISANRADGNGGGIACTLSVTGTIDNNVISGNKALMDGGGIFCGGGASPTISNNTVAEDTAGRGGGIACRDASPTISRNSIEENNAAMGGGIYCQGPSGPEILDNIISGNTTEMSGGGGILCNQSSPVVVGNLVIGNLGLTGGGGILCDQSAPTIRNNTISRNVTPGGGSGIECVTGSSPVVVNTIVAGNLVGSGFHVVGGTPSVTYCDFYDNQNGDFTGDSIIGIGILDTVNYNGDSCDMYFNILADPMFADTASADYHLTAGSPCIDGGDPDSPRDPDTTISDIGCYFFDQGMPDISLSATVLDFGAVTVGDSTGLQLVIRNAGNGALLLSSISNGLTVFRADWNPLDSLIQPFDSLVFNVTFTPGDTVAFEDTLWIENSDTLSYVQLLGVGAPVPGVRGQYYSRALPRAFAFEVRGSNPCRSSATIWFALPKAARVCLIIYDVTGRKVGTHAYGWFPAGLHEAAFDVSGLASGVYLCRLNVPGFVSTKKVVLLR